MNMIERLTKMGNFPEGAVEFFSGLYEKAEKNPDAVKCLEEAEKVYFEGGQVGDLLLKLSEVMAERKESTDMMFLIYCAEKLEGIYKEKGYSDDMYLGVLTDLKCKTVECYTVYGYYGTFVFSWFQRFYLCTRFCLGRLQYETVEAICDYEDKVKKGDAVIGCHIPSSGRLLPEEVDKSFKMAYDFYGFKDEMIVQCASWMLYPKYAEEGVFPEGSNLRYFYDLFNVAESYEEDYFKSHWRVFGTTDPDLKKIPRDSGLRKRLAEFFEKHGHSGVGRGFMFYK